MKKSDWSPDNQTAADWFTDWLIHWLIDWLINVCGCKHSVCLHSGLSAVRLYSLWTLWHQTLYNSLYLVLWEDFHTVCDFLLQPALFTVYVTLFFSLCVQQQTLQLLTVFACVWILSAGYLHQNQTLFLSTGIYRTPENRHTSERWTTQLQLHRTE